MSDKTQTAKGSVNDLTGDELYCSQQSERRASRDVLMMTNEWGVGRKDDTSKRRYSLLPTGTVNSVVDVLEAGAIKYAPDNWQKVPDARRRYYDAAMRHIDAWWSGELKDDETGLPHLAHAMCCLLFLMWFDSEGGK